MPTPADLFTVLAQPSARGLVLLHSFTGFLDAGGAGRLAVEQLVALGEPRELVRFDVDELVDYRSQRPRLIFERDRYISANELSLTVRELRDASGAPFLVLSGPEPDLRWDRFVAAVDEVVEHFGVRLVVGLHAIPWPAPHTRPVGMTVHGTAREIVEAHPAWLGTVEVPGHVAGLLELRLGDAGHPVVGYAAHVPHYLAQIDYPRAASALLEAVSAGTGLVLPVGELEAAATRVLAEVEAQFAQAVDNSAVVTALEEQYDAVVRSRGEDPAGRPVDVPTADEIGAQVETFLAELDRPDRDG